MTPRPEGEPREAAEPRPGSRDRPQDLRRAPDRGRPALAADEAVLRAADRRAHALPAHVRAHRRAARARPARAGARRRLRPRLAERVPRALRLLGDRDRHLGGHGRDRARAGRGDRAADRRERRAASPSSTPCRCSELPWSDRFDAAILYDTMHHFDDELATLEVILTDARARGPDLHPRGRAARAGLGGRAAADRGDGAVRDARVAVRPRVPRGGRRARRASPTCGGSSRSTSWSRSATSEACSAVCASTSRTASAGGRPRRTS